MAHTKMYFSTFHKFSQEIFMTGIEKFAGLQCMFGKAKKCARRPEGMDGRRGAKSRDLI
jgi:hypothetical protein